MTAFITTANIVHIAWFICNLHSSLEDLIPIEFHKCPSFAHVIVDKAERFGGQDRSFLRTDPSIRETSLERGVDR